MSSGFKVVGDHDDKGFISVDISSITVTVDDLLELIAGATVWTAVTSSSNYFTRKGIAQESVTTSATEIKIYEVDGTERVEAEAVASSDSADNGDRMAATDSNTVNNSGTDVSGQAVVFVQDRAVGASSDNRILGRILVGNGVDPDAS